ncbi:TRAP transporter large permease [Sphingosinicella sp. CPCC 101087]|uniref:TRAP transporter large permease n=1 Tax=Sphingosinicella sp. CPCC 101087 TaxID=2497754 RepID=UPI001FB10A4D|nr:TRAP transporter large permease [Sphingosinicella sp. CPCC 101087]
MTATPETGLVGILVLLVLLTLGTPVGVALGLVGIGGLTIVIGLEPAIIKGGVVLFETISRYELGTLPLFLLMAHLCFSANASRDIFDAAAGLVGHRRGGLAFAGVGGCAAFGAINGSSLATAATIGMVALPEMRRRGYSDELATGSIAAGGTLGQMIPPSGALIVFGIIAEQSIGTLFTAAIIPGITQMLFYFAAIWLLVRFRPQVAPATPRLGWPERWAALRKIVDIFLLILLVIGGIALGWFTPTEAAAVGAVGALAISAVRRRLSWSSLQTALEETLRTSGLIYVVVVGAVIFSVFVGVTGLADAIGEAISSIGTGPITTVLLIALFLLLLGSVLDGLALMLLTTPILLPIIVELGLSPIWFGIFIVRAMEIGFVHPPIGMNLYVIQRIAGDVPISRIFRGVLPFLAADFLHLLAIILFPAMVLALPLWLGQ